jgi:hypothetical protein
MIWMDWDSAVILQRDRAVWLTLLPSATTTPAPSWPGERMPKVDIGGTPARSESM